MIPTPTKSKNFAFPKVAYSVPKAVGSTEEGLSPAYRNRSASLDSKERLPNVSPAKRESPIAVSASKVKQLDLIPIKIKFPKGIRFRAHPNLVLLLFPSLFLPIFTSFLQLRTQLPLMLKQGVVAVLSSVNLSLVADTIAPLYSYARRFY